MATQEEINRLITTFAERKCNKVEITVKNKTILKIIEILDDRSLVKITKKGNIYQLRVTISEINKIDKVVKAKQIANIAREILPSISGVLILSTPKGIMSHEEAMKNNTGGKILISVY